MAIPGLKPSFDVRAKVRFGVKLTSKKGVEYPSTVDYFLSEDPEFSAKFSKPKTLQITLPFEKPEDNFGSGLEWWQGALLACYAKGEEKDGQPVAFRRSTLKQGNKTTDLLAGTTLLSEDVIGNDRRMIVCPVRECPLLKEKKCKPMGRLQFFIVGLDPSQGVFQLDTKSWNSIERMEAFLSTLGDPRGQVLTLRLEVVNRGTEKFTVVYLESNVEAPVEINNDKDIALADALIALRGVVDGEMPEDLEMKTALAHVFDVTRPGWKQDGEFVEKFKARLDAVGLVDACKATLERYEL